MFTSREKTIDAIAKAEVFDVDPQRGLTSEQVQLRIQNKLVNKTKKRVSKSYGKIVFDNLCNPFNLLEILIIGVMAYAHLPFSHFFFGIILGANIILGLAQDIHARHLIEKLKVVTDDKVHVLRNGEIVNVAANEVVLSDILVLSQGDQLPADGVVVYGTGKMDESLLTGESDAVAKAAGDPVMSGSFVSSGQIYVQVTKIGSACYAETLQSSASKFQRPKSEIGQVTWNITVSCAAIAFTFGIASFVLWLVRQYNGGQTWDTLFNPLSDTARKFIEGVSGSMVAMLPTGLFLLTSMTLAVGVIQLAKRKMLVQELYCIEMLARVNTICFDKTGTLTDGSMSVEEILLEEGFTDEDVSYAIRAILSSTKDENPTATALRTRFGDEFNETIASSIPFDSEKKYSACFLENGEACIMGALGFAHVLTNDKTEKIIEDYAEKGFRCLVVGKGKTSQIDGIPTKKVELCGILIISDHVKEDAKASVAWFQENGVDVRVISGDNAITVSEIAKIAGVEGADRYISMENVDLEAIPVIANQYKIFGRTSPKQKAALITAFKEQGKKVAMTGDGVNDILALKIADCSIAMASGSAATKNVSHLVALESDFSKLPDVVAQGRRVINNLQRTCSLFLSKTTFAVLLSTIFFILGAAGGMNYPFSTANMLVWETFGIGIPAFFLAMQPSNEPLKGSYAQRIILKAIPAGLAEVVAAFVPFLFYFAWPSSIGHNPDLLAADTIGMAVLCFTIMSFVVLLVICMPPTRYRMMIFFSMLAFAIGIVMLDFFLRDGSYGRILHICWDGYQWSFLLILLLSTGVSTGVYFLLRFLANTLSKRFLK